MVFEDLLSSMIAGLGFTQRFYDDIRLVDPATKAVLAHVDSGSIEEAATAQECYEYFGLSKPCENCTSMIALQNNEQVVKVDYVYPHIYITIAEPILHNDKWYVVEMHKNITKSGIIGIDGKEAIAHEPAVKAAEQHGIQGCPHQNLQRQLY